MTETLTRDLRVQRLTTPAVLIIAAFALVTVGIALWLRMTGHPLGQMPTSGAIDYASNPMLHAHTLGLIAIILSGLGYAYSTDPDKTLAHLLKQGVVGVALAIAIIRVTNSQGGSNIVTTLTGQPVFTLTAITIGVAYFAAMHTRYDWLAINLAALAIAPPLIASYSTTSLTTLVGGLVITAIIDYIAVHRSSVMMNLAKSVIPLRTPIAFFAPTTARSLSDALDDDDFSGIRMLGLGDVAIPGIFIVALAGQFTLVSLPVVTAVIGYIVAYALLTIDLFDRATYAGLPFLNAGVLLGAAVALPFV